MVLHARTTGSSIAIDFKKIFDYMASTRQNQNYWALNNQERINV